MYNEADYFDVSSKLKPLLHLWSLGVEEQFYIVFPILLWLMYRLNIKFIVFIIAFALISFGLNIYGLNNKAQTFVFYMPWTRFWELLSGAILAYCSLYYKCNPKNCQIDTSNIYGRLLHCSSESEKYLNDISSIFGFLIIIIGYFTIVNDGNFPGFWALIPVFGAIFIIAAGPESFVNKRLLSTKIFVFLGLISYPLYLWHWSLLSYLYILFGEDAPRNYKIFVIFISVVLAILTFYFAEPYFRYSNNPARKSLFLLITLIIVGLSGGYIYKHHGIESRVSNMITIAKSEVDEQASIYNMIEQNSINMAKVYPIVLKGDQTLSLPQNEVKQSVAVIGDSFAGHLLPGLVATYGQSVTLFAASGQLPLINTRTLCGDLKVLNDHAKFGRIYGYKIINQGYEHVIKDPNIDVVLLSHNTNCDFEKIEDLTDVTETSRIKIYENSMKRSLDILTNHRKKVIIILNNPVYTYNVGSICNNQRPLFSFIDQNLEKCSKSRKNHEEDAPFIDYKVTAEKLSKKYKDVYVYDLTDIFCDEIQCTPFLNGILSYKDSGHLNFYGSKFVGQKLSVFIDKIRKE